MSKFYTHVHSYRNEMLVRGYENGQRFKRSIPYKPYLFIPSKTGNTEYRTLEGVRVDKIQFDSLREGRDFIKRYKDVDGFNIYGMSNFTYPFIRDYFPDVMDYDQSLIAKVTLDIEVAADDGFPSIELADKEITAITLYKDGKYLTLGCGDYNNTNPDVTYIKCENEARLLMQFMDSWRSPEWVPDIITGWNVEFFDIPYIVNRLNRVLGPEWGKKLSPWELLEERVIEFAGREQSVYVPAGITILDYLQLYKKFSYTPQESYKLDHIAFYELGEKKLDYGEHESLLALYRNDYQKFIDYNIRDVELVQRLEAKLKFIEQVFAIAYDARSNYADTFTTVRLWDVIIHNHLLDQGIVVHQLQIPEHDRGILGGYVKAPQVGMHEWVVSLDLNSLYPHIIMQYNISPETFAGWFPGNKECWIKEEAERRLIESLDGYLKDKQDFIKENNIAVAANMTTFSRDFQGFLPALMQKYYDERVVYKGKMIEAKKAYETATEEERVQLTKDIAKFNNMQMAKKIQLNSAYGALGNKYFRWYRNEFAEAITASGQLTTRWIERKLNELLNKTFSTEDVDYVIACDTDSVYIKADGFMKLAGRDLDKQQQVKYLDRICTQMLEPYIEKCYQELCEYVNGYEQKMKMKRECIADKGIWTAKKRYILNVYNQEGVAYAEPKLKMMGIEAIRTSTPEMCRKSIKQALHVIMNQSEEDMIEFIDKHRTEFKNASFEAIAFPRGVNDLDKYSDSVTVYKKATPIHVRGALMYNYMLKKNGLTKQYPLLSNKEKVKFCYLRVPNPSGGNVIAAPGTLPKQFNLDKYIDYDTQFEKSFLDPIKTILDAIGWKTEKSRTIDEFF